MAFMFESLQVYQKAVDFADEVTCAAETFPRGYYFLADQLNRQPGTLNFERNWKRLRSMFILADGMGGHQAG